VIDAASSKRTLKYSSSLGSVLGSDLLYVKSVLKLYTLDWMENYDYPRQQPLVLTENFSILTVSFGK